MMHGTTNIKFPQQYSFCFSCRIDFINQHQTTFYCSYRQASLPTKNTLSPLTLNTAEIRKLQMEP